MRTLLSRVPTLAGALLAVAVLAPPARAFDVSKLYDVWMGSWTNKTFGSTGTVYAMLQERPDGNLDLFWSLTGNVFGCSSDPSGTLTLIRGVDFDETLTLTRTDPLFGALDLNNKKKKVRGGATGTCDGAGPAWEAKTKLRGTKTFAGNLAIEFPDGEKAKTKFKTSRGYTPPGQTPSAD